MISILDFINKILYNIQNLNSRSPLLKIKKFLDKGIVAEFLGEIVDITQKGVDSLDLFEGDGLLSAIPMGKIVKYILTKVIKISNIDEAFNKLYQIAFFTTFYNALQVNNINLRISDKELKALLNELKTNSNFKAEEFNLDNFYSNKIYDFFCYHYNIILSGSDLPENKAKQVAAYIQTELKITFYLILDECKTQFEIFNHYIDSTLYKEELKKFQKKEYFNNLISQFKTPILDDPKGVSLKALYVSPFYIERKAVLEYEEMYRTIIKVSSKKHNSSIHQYISNFIESKNPNLLFIQGYPGQGKTSLCKKVIYDYDNFKNKKKIYSLKLKNIIDIESLLKSPLKYINNFLTEQIFNKATPEHLKELSESVILLDGLDELAISNGLSTKSISHLCTMLLKELDNNKNLKFIITTRYGLINEKLYAEREDEISNSAIIDLSPFNVEQQISWQKKYSNFYPNTHITHELLKEINNSDNFAALKELVNQPSLLYMLATTNIKIDKNLNTGYIYDKLFNTLVSRKYEESGQSCLLQSIDQQELRDFLGNLAFSIYKSNRSYISKTELQKKKSISKFFDKLGYEHLRESLSGLMVIFYLQKKSIDNDDFTVEFIQKSLFEYLVAENIWNKIKKIKVKTKFEKALREYNKIFSTRLLTPEITNHLIEIITNDHSIDKNKFAATISNYLTFFLKKDFLYQYSYNSQNRPIDIALNTFYGYWTVLSHLGTKKNFISKKNKKRFIYLLQILLKKQKNLSHKSILLLNLSFQDLSFCNLSYLTFINTKFIHSNLEQTDFESSKFKNVDFTGSNMKDSHLYNSIIAKGDFTSTNLENSIFDRVYIYKCNFHKSNLSNISGESFVILSSIFNEVDFSKSRAWKCDFTLSSFTNTNFTGSYLRDSIFESTKHKNSTFTSTNLGSVDMHDSKLICCSFESTWLEFTNLNSSLVDNYTYKQIEKKGGNVDRVSKMTDMIKYLRNTLKDNKEKLGEEGWQKKRERSRKLKQSIENMIEKL